jgi:hypothetical protein
MALVGAHRFSFVTRLTDWCARHRPTPQERVDRYLSMMPIAVLPAKPGGPSPDGGALRGTIR